MTGFASAEQILLDVAELYRPPRRISVSKAATEKMKVVDGAGRVESFNPASTSPYVIEPMDCLSSRLYDTLVFVGPARSSKTLGLVDGWVCYVVSSNPGDMLIIQISQEKAAEYSRKRIGRMLNHSPELSPLLSPRGHDNNIHDRTFKAGNYLGLKWPSPKVFASSDYKYVALTDYDRLSDDLGGEGDGYIQASKRTETFMSSGMTLVESSPGKDVEDEEWSPDPRFPHMAPPTTGILALYNLGDRRRLYWQCLGCAGWFQPVLENFSLESECPFCPHCGQLIDDPSLKRGLNANSRWVPEGCDLTPDGELIGERRDTRIASFWMEGPAASYQTWSKLASKLKQAEEVYEQTGNQENLKTVINTDWGRPYLYRKAENKRSAEAIKDRVEDALGERVVPPGVRCLFAAVDIQGGKHRRFVVQVIGYGADKERWLIDRFSLRLSNRKDEDGESLPVEPAAYPEDWRLLIEHVFEKTYPLSDGSGRVMPILRVAFDTGGESDKDNLSSVTDNAYKFYRYLRREGLHRKAMPVKGASTHTAPLMRETWPDSTKRKDRHASSRGDVPVYQLNIHKLMDTISAGLEREEPGPGYIHFPSWLGDWFFKELTCEQRDEKGRWEKSSSKVPNEAADCFRYADAAAMLHGYDKIDWNRPPPWARDWDENSEIEQNGTRQAARNSDKPADRQRRRTRFRFN